MKTRTYAIHEAVFKQFPGYSRGVVVIDDVHNGPSSPDLVSQLRTAESAVRNTFDLDDLANQPSIASWREAYRSFGAKPSKFRPSMEALMRRVLRGEALRSITSLVDIGTIISLRHHLPSGGHAIDVVTNDLSLRPATGQETFMAFGSDQQEAPEAGEIVFTEGDIVLTRRWTWRQATHTLLAPETTSVEFNVDGLPPTSRDCVKTACEEIAELVQTYCGGTAHCHVLTEHSPSLLF